MDIQDALRKRLEDRLADEPHVAGKADQIDLSSRKCGDYLAVVFLAPSRATFNDERFNSTFSCALQTSSVAPIADHDCDFSIGNRAQTYSIRQRNHVRTATGDQNSDALCRRTVGHLLFVVWKNLIQVMLQVIHIVFH